MISSIPTQPISVLIWRSTSVPLSKAAYRCFILRQLTSMPPVTYVVQGGCIMSEYALHHCGRVDILAGIRSLSRRTPPLPECRGWMSVAFTCFSCSVLETFSIHVHSFTGSNAWVGTMIQGFGWLGLRTREMAGLVLRSFTLTPLYAARIWLQYTVRV